MKNNVVRFLLTFFLGWIGSFIINHSSLKPDGFKSRTAAYIFLTLITCGIYSLVASICNIAFDPSKPKNIGYKKDSSFKLIKKCFSFHSTVVSVSKNALKFSSEKISFKFPWPMGYFKVCYVLFKYFKIL